MSQSLHEILDGYTATLCGKCFEYELKNGQIIRVIFYKEHLCHLLGIHHVYNCDKHYLGASGYAKIESEEVTIKSLKLHNEKQFNFVKEKIAHFPEIESLMSNCTCFRFYEDRCSPRTSISADFLLHKDNTDYRLHLFLRKERDEQNLYSPVSFVVKTANDKLYDQFLTGQERKKIEKFRCFAISEKNAS